MKSPCTSCHWLKKFFCIVACQSYDDYANVTDVAFRCECGGTISFYPVFEEWQCNKCDDCDTGENIDFV